MKKPLSYAQRDQRTASRLATRLGGVSVFGPVEVEASDIYPLILRAIRYGRRMERSRMRKNAARYIVDSGGAREETLLVIGTA